MDIKNGHSKWSFYMSIVARHQKKDKMDIKMDIKNGHPKKDKIDIKNGHPKKDKMYIKNEPF